MRIFPYSFILAVCSLLLLISCEGQKDCELQQDTIITIINPEGIENCTTIENADSDLNFVINSTEEFNSIFTCNNSNPLIDFENYTLLIVKKVLPWCCATELIREEVILGCEEYKYNVVLKEPEGKYHAITTYYYSALIPKIPNNQSVKFNVRFEK